MPDFYPVYEGNAALGVGTGSNITPDANTFAQSEKAWGDFVAQQNKLQEDRLKIISDTQRTIALLRQEDNMKMFAQKVQDRDAMHKAYLDGSAKVDNYLQQDEPLLKKARNDYDNAYEEFVTKGINNEDALKKFKKASDSLNDIAAKIATRYTQFGLQEKVKSETKDERIRNGMDANIKNWSNTPGAMPTFYQQFNDYNEKDVNDLAKYNTTTQTGIPYKDAATGLVVFRDLKSDIFDYDATKNSIAGALFEGGATADAIKLHKQYINSDDILGGGMGVKQREEFVQQANNRIDEYNAKINGYNKLHPNEVPKQTIEHVKVDKLGHILDNDFDFNAKFLLLNHKDNTSFTPNKEMTDALYKKQQLDINREKANAYVAHQYAQIKKLKNEEDRVKHIENDFNSNLASTDFTKQNVGAGVFIPVFTVDKNGKSVMLKPIGAKDKTEEVKYIDSQGNEKTRTVTTGYTGGYYGRGFKLNGADIKQSDLFNKFIDLYKQKKGIKLYNKDLSSDKDINTQFNNFVKSAINNGSLKIYAIGENGAIATPETQSQHVMEQIKKTSTRYGTSAEDEQIPLDDND